MASQFELDQLAKYKERLAAYQDAALALASGAILTYSLDTGQSRTSVTKQNISTLERVIDGLLNQIMILEQRCGISNGTTIVRPIY